MSKIGNCDERKSVKEKTYDNNQFGNLRLISEFRFF
jgi:hypothetical protein